MWSFSSFSSSIMLNEMNTSILARILTLRSAATKAVHHPSQSPCLLIMLLQCQPLDRSSTTSSSPNSSHPYNTSRVRWNKAHHFPKFSPTLPTKHSFTTPYTYCLFSPVDKTQPHITPRETLHLTLFRRCDLQPPHPKWQSLVVLSPKWSYLNSASDSELSSVCRK